MHENVQQQLRILRHDKNICLVDKIMFFVNWPELWHVQSAEIHLIKSDK